MRSVRGREEGKGKGTGTGKLVKRVRGDTLLGGYYVRAGTSFWLVRSVVSLKLTTEQDTHTYYYVCTPTCSSLRHRQPFISATHTQVYTALRHRHHLPHPHPHTHTVFPSLPAPPWQHGCGLWLVWLGFTSIFLFLFLDPHQRAKLVGMLK